MKKKLEFIQAIKPCEWLSKVYKYSRNRRKEFIKDTFYKNLIPERFLIDKKEEEEEE